ncbi:MAG: TIM barrel protein [Lachnoclostridium sp.]|jgi:deoxyribonuclease-4|nr:TIM barrel protein [Lachnoclostridium sp.]
MIKFGVAGYPLAYTQTPYKNDRSKIFEWLREIDLDAFEAQMTYGPKTSIDNCKTIKSLSSDLNIKVSVHAAYYIVLTSSDKIKVQRSIETLKKTFELANLMGADVVVLHPGPYYGKDPVEIYNILEQNLYTFFNDVGQSEIGLFLETAGKKGQLGSVDEILGLSKSIKGCFPCVDFGHVHARMCGGLGCTDDIDRLFDKLNTENAFSNRIHFHYTPIDYGPQGEITHKSLDDEYPTSPQQSLFENGLKTGVYHPRYERIVENLKKTDASFTVISETHNSQEKGAMALKQYYSKLL